MSINDKVKQRESELELAIYFAREMISELGKEKALEIIGKAWAQYGADSLNRRLEGVAQDERLGALGEFFKKQLADRSDLKVIESTPKRLSIEIHNCPTYDVCEKYGVPEVCQAYCDSDYVSAKAIHPKVKLVRDREIAYGADYCNHSWVMEE